MKNVAFLDTFVDLTEKICKSKTKNIAIVAIEIRKAFDTADHIIYLRYLRESVFVEFPQGLMRSYLANRKQYIQVTKHA